MRATVDTQVWVRAFLNPRGLAGKVSAALVGRQFTLVTSESLVDELADVLTRPRVARKHRRRRQEVAAYVEMIREHAELVMLPGRTRVCRDADDNVLIEAADLGAADCLVSEDEDLHADEVREYLAARGIRVVRVPAFVADLQGAGSVAE